jgi:hypothetical protein
MAQENIETFSPDTRNFWNRTFRGYVLAVIVLVIFILIKLYLPDDNHFRFRNSLILVLFPLLFVFEFLKSRTRKITIDKSNEMIIIESKALLLSRDIYQISFEDFNLVVDENVRFFKMGSKMIGIIIYKNKIEVCRVNSRNDGYSQDNLNGFLKSIERLKLDIKYL